MTVLEWLDSGNMYSSFERKHYVRIALDRGVDPDANVYDETLVSERQKALMEADIIYTAVLKRPSNTASISQSHNGFQKSIGSEQDFYQDDKIQQAIRIYKRYGDVRGEELAEAANRRKIRFIPIKDVFRL